MVVVEPTVADVVSITHASNINFCQEQCSQRPRRKAPFKSNERCKKCTVSSSNVFVKSAAIADFFVHAVFTVFVAYNPAVIFACTEIRKIANCSLKMMGKQKEKTRKWQQKRPENVAITGELPLYAEHPANHSQL